MTSRVMNDPPRPGSPQWRGMVTGSKIAAILGLSRFTSPYALWHEMAGLVEPPEFDPELGAWGHLAEQSLASWWAHHNPGWQLNTPTSETTEVTYTRDDLPFPNLATLDRRARRGRHFHIIECKTARSLASWGKPDEDDSVPADYYAQVLWQMGISGIHEASVVVLGPAGPPEIHAVEWSETAFAGLVERAAEWVLSLKAGTPPGLDGSVATYDTVRGLHPDIDETESVEVPLEQAVAWLDAAHTAKEATARERRAKSEIGLLMGTAKTAVVNIPGRSKAVKIADRRARAGGTPSVYINKNANLEKE